MIRLPISIEVFQAALDASRFDITCEQESVDILRRFAAARWPNSCLPLGARELATIVLHAVTLNGIETGER